MIGNNEQLRELYVECNKEYFNGELYEGIKIDWSNRMTRVAGMCYYKNLNDGSRETTRIGLSTHYHKRYPEEIINTLVHEMIHQLYPHDGHGELFHSKCKELNEKFGLNLRQFSKGRALVKYVYKCKNCSGRWERSKALNLGEIKCSCGSRIELEKDLEKDLTKI